MAGGLARVLARRRTIQSLDFKAIDPTDNRIDGNT
jgi:hypothetical protein